MSYTALHDLDLELSEGKMTAIIGQTGSGKSTLVQHLNALLLPTGGTVYVLDREIHSDAKPKGLKSLRGDVGLVFQFPEYQLFEETVIKDVMFGPKNFGVSEEEARKKAEQALKLTGFDQSLFERSPLELSGGQKRRVAIAGILAMDPKVLVLDEPTAMLDPSGRKEVLKTVQELRTKKQVTVILITHYMEEVIDADKIYVMDHGHVVMEGTPREIFSQVDTLKKYRLDVPQVTILADELRKRGLDIPAGILRKEELVEALCRSN